MTSDEILKFEPHVIAEVKANGTVSVGRKHAGKKVYVYILRDSDAEE